jgi:hypothetical protein
MMKLGYAERSLLRVLWIKDRGLTQYARVYNTRRNYSNLTIYRALEKAGKLTIHTVDNATTENMLYGMSNITFTLKGN